MSGIIPYALLAVGLAATLLLFVSVKREIYLTRLKNRRQMEELIARMDVAKTRDPEPVIAQTSAPTPRSGLNLSSRVQAMRMLRRNEDISHVAAALGVTRKEIELLIRVQAIGHAPDGKAAAKAAGQDL